MAKLAYLCPTEKRERFSSAEELLDKHKQYDTSKEADEKNFNFFTRKSCEFKKSLYLCSPK